MANSNTFRPGKHFLQIPGPTNVPDRVLRAMDYPTIDHRGPDFAEIGLRVLDKIKLIFKTSEPVIIFPASGTGAWEAAMEFVEWMWRLSGSRACGAAACRRAR